MKKQDASINPATESTQLTVATDKPASKPKSKPKMKSGNPVSNVSQTVADNQPGLFKGELDVTDSPTSTTSPDETVDFNAIIEKSIIKTTDEVSASDKSVGGVESDIANVSGGADSVIEQSAMSVATSSDEIGTLNSVDITGQSDEPFNSDVPGEQDAVSETAESLNSDTVNKSDAVNESDEPRPTRISAKQRREELDSFKSEYLVPHKFEKKHNVAIAITGSSDLAQRVDRKSFSANNDLKLVKRNEKKLFTLISRNTFVYRPDRLAVTGDEDAVQSVGTTDFRSTTETKLAFLSNLYATPQVDYERNGWRTSLTMPLKWLHYSVSGQHDYINASPRLYVKRQLTAKSDISGSVTYSLGSPQPYLNITAPVLSDYRNLFIADNPDKYSQNVAATLSYRYRNPLKSMFFNLSATYNHSRSSIMSNQLFIDDFIISTYADRLSDSNSWYVKGGFSKGLGHSKMVVGCDVDASTASASSMRDNAMIPYHQIAAGVKPYFKGSLTKWLSANYEASYGFSKLKIDGEANDYHTFRQNIFTTIIPNDIVQFTVGAEHFLTRFPEGNTANLVLLDASAVWRLNNKVRLSLTANNVLNRRSYEYVNYGTLSRSEHHFRIRPRSILASIQYRF